MAGKVPPTCQLSDIMEINGWPGLAVRGPCIPMEMPSHGYPGDSRLTLRRPLAAMHTYISPHPDSPTYMMAALSHPT